MYHYTPERRSNKQNIAVLALTVDTVPAGHLQRVKDKCQGKHAPHGIKLLPFDLCGSPEALQQAASQAVQAFPQCSVQYLIHNAGMSHLLDCSWLCL